MNNINTFIKKKLKERHIKMDTLIKKSEVSKSTIYRVMNGLQRPSEELLNNLSSILKLNALEQRELRYYSNLVDTDDEILSARSAVSELLYSKRPTNSEKIELIYYHGEKYVRDLNKIFSNILSVSEKPEFSCNIRIVNCCQDIIVSHLFDFVSRLSKSHRSYDVEHLVSFSSHNSKENIVVLGVIIPLLPLDKYKVLYSESGNTSSNSIFNDFLIIDYSYLDANGKQVEQHLYISLMYDAFSTCYVADNEHIQEFFERGYENLRRDFKLTLNSKKSFEFYGQFMLELEAKYDICLFKPNPCYDKIPMEVYNSIISRSSREEKFNFVASFLEEEVTDETLDAQFDGLYEYIKERVDLSFKKRRIDILTRKGMESFASTGKLSDQLAGLPLFNAQEIKTIFEYLKKRNSDKNDKYNFYITKSDEYNNEEYLISAFKDSGLMIEYNNPHYITNHMPQCIIEHKGISETFFDFAENYVPTMVAMSKEEADDFLDELIEKYCK